MPAEIHPPVCPIQIELGAEFSDLLLPDVQAAAQARLEAAVQNMLEALGIPGQPSVALQALTAPADDPRPLRLYVSGQECFYPATVLARCHAYAYREANPDDPSALVECAVQTVSGILLHQPQALLGPEQAEAYRLSLDLPEAPADWPLSSILQNVLAMRISLGDQQTVAATLAAGLQDGDSPLAIAEELISRLRPPQLEIHLPPAYLRALTLDSSADDQGFFQTLRDVLFNELGQLYPTIRFVPSKDLPPRWFSFRLNHLISLPFPGLEPGTFAVDTAATNLPIPDAQPATNPANGNPMSIVPAAALPQVPNELIVWSPLRFIVLQLAAVLRQHGSLLVDNNVTSLQLERLEDSYPDLISAARDQFSLAQLTRMLRAFAAEGLSIRNFRQILENALDFDTVVVPQPETYVILDGRLPTGSPPSPDWLADPLNLAAFIRMHMEAEITYRFTRGSDSLSVYTVAAEIESQILALSDMDQTNGAAAELAAQVLNACRRIIDPNPMQHQNTPMVTTAEVRPHLRTLLAIEFPQLPVIAYQELTPNVSLTVADRITLEP